MSRQNEIKALRDWIVGARHSECAAAGCPIEGLQYRENYHASHVLEIHEDPFTAPSIEGHAYVYDEDDAPYSVEVFCPACGRRTVFATEDVPDWVLDKAISFKRSMREEPNG